MKRTSPNNQSSVNTEGILYFCCLRLTIYKSQSAKTHSIMQRLEFVDFARGYAICTIVLYHILQHAALSPLAAQGIALGGTGVHLFFALSGFGLLVSTPGHLEPLAFYRRRLSKIWLPFVLVLSISLAAHYAFGFFPNGWKAWVGGVLMYQMFSDEYIEAFGGHFWFISAIIQFYLVFPALLWLLRRWGGLRFFVLGLLVSIAWWCLIYAFGKSSQRSWNSCFLQFLWEFALGMAIGSAFLQQKKWLSRLNAYRWAALPLGLLSVALMALMILKWGIIGKIFNDIPAFFGYSLLCFAVYDFSRRFWPFLKRFFLWVGEFSFSLYLIHVLVLDAYLAVLKPFMYGMPIGILPLLLVFPIMLGLAWGFEPLSQRWVKSGSRFL
jgi:peptidoglycan/LPS O-acetylase OafA/YrhL